LKSLVLFRCSSLHYWAYCFWRCFQGEKGKTAIVVVVVVVFRLSFFTFMGRGVAFPSDSIPRGTDSKGGDVRSPWPDAFSEETQFPFALDRRGSFSLLVLRSFRSGRSPTAMALHALHLRWVFRSCASLPFASCFFTFVIWLWARRLFACLVFSRTFQPSLSSRSLAGRVGFGFPLIIVHFLFMLFIYLRYPRGA